MHCCRYQVLLEVQLPHRRHKLQLISSVISKALNTSYSEKLVICLYRHQDLAPVTKGSLFLLFFSEMPELNGFREDVFSVLKVTFVQSSALALYKID